MFSAYEKYATRFGLNVNLLDWDEGHIVAKVSGNNVGRYFRYEGGKHVVQRVPPTEHNGRKQTSVVVVAILPLPPEQKMKPLPESEMEITAQCGKQRAGGQNVNRVHSACRVKHIPTGISVFINGRDFHKNKKEAIKIVTTKVNDKYISDSVNSYNYVRKNTLGDGNRGSKIRTYNFIESRAVDHRFGIKTSNMKAIMNGHFEIFWDKGEIKVD